jgi:hypothetical protein
MMRACLTLLLFLLPLCAMAQDGIHRCIGPDGNPLFTDQPCAALQATPVNPPPAPASASPVMQGSTTAAPAITCAGTVAELRQSMVDAFAARDPNRLAGLMIWNGYGRDAVVANIRSLGSLMQQPMLDIRATSDEDASSSGTTEDPVATEDRATPRQGNGEGEQLIVHTASNDGSGAPRESRFTIVRRSGCLWLRPAG